MKTIATIIASIALFASLQAEAGVTPVFVSCYSDDGSHLQMIFDTEQKQFSYREAVGEMVTEFESAPAGHLGLSSSSVTTAIPADQQHIELKAHVVGGDVIAPIFTHVKMIFDRDPTGSVKLTSYEVLHMDQSYNIDRFKVGVCYVQ